VNLLTDPARYYFLPLSRSCDCGNCEYLGCRNKYERTLEDVNRAVARACSAQYNGVLFPSSLLACDFREEVIRSCRRRGLQVIVQIRLSAFNPQWQKFLTESEAIANFILDEVPSWSAPLTTSPHYFTYVIVGRVKPLRFLRSLATEVRDRVHLYIPYHQIKGDGRWTAERVGRLLNQIEKKFGKQMIRPPRGVEIWDSRIDHHLCLEPMDAAVFTSRVSSGVDSSIRVSVIIPTYQNQAYVGKTVAHLLAQTLSRDLFEIIVVDDGGDDESLAALKTLIENELSPANFKYIYSPRPRRRQMGDANFRAGVSRNLGVKNAVGEILCFLDSDILTPPTYLEQILREHEEVDVLQIRRYDLTTEASSSSRVYTELTSGDLQPPDSYWRSFFNCENWPELTHFWKYTCTYGLSMRAELFKRMGWFKRNYVFYGFEDTDLGYRLAQAGCRFRLSSIVGYHLHHFSDRSEFNNSTVRRRALLQQTAQIFFLNHLDSDVYQLFKSLISPHTSFMERLQNGLGGPTFIPHRSQMRTSRSIVQLPTDKFYHLPIYDRCRVNCQLCEVNGCLQQSVLSVADIERHFQRATYEQYRYVVFPPNFSQHPERLAVLELAQVYHLQTIVQVYAKYGFIDLREYGLWIERGCQFEVLMGDIEDIRSSHLFDGAHLNKSVLFFTFVPQHRIGWVNCLEHLSSAMSERLRFFFPVPTVTSHQFLSCDDIFGFCEELQARRPTLTILPSRPYDMAGATLPLSPDSKLSPEPEWLAASEEGLTPVISVVIATYRQSAQFMRVFAQLLEQDLCPTLYEIIVVDDGNIQPVRALIENLLETASVSICVRYLQLTRSDECRNDFRAGQTRDAGARFARGECLVFLDSDIVVPRDFLSDVHLQFANHDVIQYERRQLAWHLDRSCSYEQLCENSRADHRYWQRFYAAEAWQALPHFWKYTSSYCLALKKSDYQKVNGFAKGFRSYGFEDTLLGYKLSQLNLRWHVRRRPVIHLQDSSRASSLQNYIRSARSARLFYHMTLSRDFYLLFFSLLGENIRLRAMIARLGRSTAWRWLSAVIFYSILFLRRPCLRVNINVRVHWTLTYPLRKIYYFSKYQLETRVLVRPRREVDL
jgi:glycosyltransferase involved in cell wall biosynthesis